MHARSSKDALIRVWRRSTLEPFCDFRGHEGPVNAVGLQNGRIVSASGDGRMMLWDIQAGERVRTFEGHDRGLACIDFKVRSAFCLVPPPPSEIPVLFKHTLPISSQTRN